MPLAVVLILVAGEARSSQRWVEEPLGAAVDEPRSTGHAKEGAIGEVLEQWRKTREVHGGGGLPKGKRQSTGGALDKRL
jgi:hypothetical protein